jgi:hypothetical protein
MERMELRGPISTVTRLSATAWMWQWASMKPGKTVWPRQSITFVRWLANSERFSFVVTATMSWSRIAINSARGRAESMVIARAL